ncbi:hypothetical protein Tco_0417422 [Tanacetum coccineum]
MEEYIRLQEENALSRDETFNWQTTTYGKREYCNDEDYSFTNFETEFPAIVFDDITSNTTLSCESTVSPLNDNKINFRISFDESDDEDYTVIYDENSFSYQIIFVNNLKTDSENDNDKVNMTLFSTPEPEVSYSNDLDFFIDFENEFPAIVYNDALTSKLDLLTEPTISPQHIDEFKLKDETSLSECHEKEQNVLYFNDLFSFNEIYLDDLKSDTDNDNDEINIEQPSEDMSVIPLPNVINVDIGAYAQGDDGLRGLSVVTRELSLIDMGELIKLTICMEVGDNWAWVALEEKRQPVAVSAAPGDVEECAQRRLEEEIQGLRQDVRSLQGLMKRPMTDQGRFSTWMVSCMMQLMKASGRTYQAFDGIFRGSYPEVFEMLSRRRT